MENEFYSTSRHGNCGSNVVFHNKDGCGYGTNLDRLHVFTLEEGQTQLNHDIRSMPLLKSAVDELAVWHVDHQLLGTNSEDPNDEYVIQVKQNWDGNDIAFVIMGGHSYNYKEAETFNIVDAEAMKVKNKQFEIWSKSAIDKIKRRTFQSGNINLKTMVRAAGIKYKTPRKPRPTTGKSRGNCPACGKITWGFNPYENAYCGIWCEP